MSMYIRRHILILLAVFLPFFFQRGTLYEDPFSSEIHTSALTEAASVLPYGLQLRQENSEKYRPQAESASLRQGRKTDFIPYIIRDLLIHAVCIFCGCFIISGSRRGGLFTALFVAGGNYERKLVPRSVLLF